VPSPDPARTVLGDGSVVERAVLAEDVVADAAEAVQRGLHHLRPVAASLSARITSGLLNGGLVDLNAERNAGRTARDDDLHGRVVGACLRIDEGKIVDGVDLSADERVRARGGIGDCDDFQLIDDGCPFIQ